MSSRLDGTTRWSLGNRWSRHYDSGSWHCYRERSRISSSAHETKGIPQTGYDVSVFGRFAQGSSGRKELEAWIDVC